jgi:hypothetical protein
MCFRMNCESKFASQTAVTQCGFHSVITEATPDLVTPVIPNSGTSAQLGEMELGGQQQGMH